MLALETVRQDLARVPRLARAGVWAFAVGLAADVAIHLLTGDLADAHAEHTPAELATHDLIFVGMVLILLGVVVDGVRRSRIRRVSGLGTPSGRTTKGAA